MSICIQLPNMTVKVRPLSEDRLNRLSSCVQDCDRTLAFEAKISEVHRKHDLVASTEAHKAKLLAWMDAKAMPLLDYACYALTTDRQGNVLFDHQRKLQGPCYWGSL